MDVSSDTQVADTVRPRAPVAVRVIAVFTGALLGWLAIAWLGTLQLESSLPPRARATVPAR